MKNIRLKMQKLTFFFLFLAISLTAAPLKDNGDGTITDKGTGLIWQKCTAGLNNNEWCSKGPYPADRAKLAWTDALTYCNTLSLAGKKWRLPNVNELNSLVDRTVYYPAIDTVFFPNTSDWTVPAPVYWTSTTYTGDPTIAWHVGFAVGQMEKTYNKAVGLFVRCVSTVP